MRTGSPFHVPGSRFAFRVRGHGSLFGVHGSWFRGLRGTIAATRRRNEERRTSNPELRTRTANTNRERGTWNEELRGAFAAALVIAAAAVAPLAAQWHGYPTPNIPRTPDGKANLAAPAPRGADGKPDLSGIWMAPRIRVDLAQGMKKGESIPFTPEARAIYDERRATNGKDDPGARCLPTGIPVRATLQTPFRIIQSPGVTAILYESRTQFRQILTDGRPLPQEIDWPSWQGFSVGRWEGDTFVVETTGFNGKVWLDQVGTPSSDALKLTERFHRTDFGHLDVEMIIDDRKMYTRPWSTVAQVVYQPDTELLEYICEENERDSSRMVGK